jgi:hypothetical protein
MLARILPLALIVAVPALSSAQTSAFEHVGLSTNLAHARLVRAGPSIVAVGTDGTLARTEDGSVFTPLDVASRLGSSPMAVNCTSAWENSILIGCFTTYMSEDGGHTFRASPLPEAHGMGWTVVSAGGHVVAFAGRMVMTSSDGGRTFRRGTVPAGVVDVTTAVTAGGKIFALGESRSGGHLLYVSSDGGRRYTTVPGVTGEGLTAIRAAGNVVFAHSYDGVSFRIDALAQTPALEAMSSVIDVTTVTSVAGGILAATEAHDRVLSSRDGGRTWTAFLSSPVSGQPMLFTGIGVTQSHLVIIGMDDFGSSQHPAMLRRPLAGITLP